MTPAASNFATRSCAAGALSPTPRASSAYVARAFARRASISLRSTESTCATLLRLAGRAEHARPANDQVVLDVQRVEHLRGDEVDELRDRLRRAVEARARRQHD